MAIPTKDSELVPYSTNFDLRVNSSFASFGLTSAQATAYTPKHEALVTAYDNMMLSRADGSNNKSLTVATKAAKATLLAYARELYGLVQANTSVTDENKTLLGVKVRDTHPTPTPPPDVRPGVDLVSVVARTIELNIHDTASLVKRGKPAGAVQAFVYTFLGSTYPTDPTLWQFQGAATKAKFEIVFPETVPNGQQVWICAAWVNRRGEAGPASVPISANVQGGGTSEVESLKIAA